MDTCTDTWTDNYDSRQYIELYIDPGTHDGWTHAQTHGQTWARRCLDINRQTEKHTRIILQMNKEGNINANRHVDRHRGEYVHTDGPRHALRRHRNRWTDRQARQADGLSIGFCLSFCLELGPFQRSFHKTCTETSQEQIDRQTETDRWTYTRARPFSVFIPQGYQKGLKTKVMV